MQKERTGDYVADDYVDQRILHYDDLFSSWEQSLKFQVAGRDADKVVPREVCAPAPGREPSVPAAKPKKVAVRKALKVTPKKKH